MREMIPLTTRLQHIDHRNQHLAHVHCALSAAAFRWWNERFHYLPLVVFQVVGVRFSIHFPSLFQLSPLFKWLLRLIYPQVPHQRCLFHKLRNLRDSIHIPQAMSRPDARMLKRDLMQQAWSIYDAPVLPTAVKRRDAFCLQYRTTQREMAASVERDWDECVAYLRILERYPTWPRSVLRTTSLLERVSRMI